MEEFCTIILAGGYGTRLGEVGKHTAKPLLKVGDRCILDYAVDKVCEIDSKSAIFVLVNSQFLNQYQRWIAGQQQAARLTLVNNQQVTESACPDIITNIVLTLERQRISTDLLVIGGDNLFDFSLCDFVTFGRRHGVSTVVMDVGSQLDAERFSVVVLGEDGKLVELLEKPKSPPSTLVTTCIYWFPASTLALFKEYTQTGVAAGSFGQFMQWLADREPIYGFQAKGYWHDIGTLDVYYALQRQFAHELLEGGEDEN